MSAVVIPTIADLQREFLDAGSDRGARLRARWRGYLAFWSIVLISPVMLRRWPNHHHRSSRTFRTVVATTVVTVVLGAAARPHMDEVMSWILNGLPDGTFSALGALSGLAFLAGPVALALAGIKRRTRGSSPFRLGPAEATLLSLLSVTIAVVLGTAAVVDAFESIARSGSGGLAAVVRGITGATKPLFLGLATLDACAIGIAVTTFRSRIAVPDVVTLKTTSGPAALGLSALLVAIVLSIDQLLRLYHEMLNWILVLFDPVKLAAAGGGRAVMTELSDSPAMLLIAGTILTMAVLAVAFLTWRATRGRAIHPILAHTAQAALVVVVAGALWHASVLYGDLEVLRQITASP